MEHNKYRQVIITKTILFSFFNYIFYFLAVTNLESTQCTVCKFVVSYIDTVIQNNKSEAAIEAALEKVCTILPHALNSTCVQFVQTYGPALVTLLENYTTPDKVCGALGLCHNGTQEVASGL